MTSTAQHGGPFYNRGHFLKVIASGGTDIGKRRGHNEDSFGVFDDLGLYIVADGMGGHAAGEVASGAAVETLHDFIAATAGSEDTTWPYERDEKLSRTANRLAVGIRLANKVIFEKSHAEQEKSGMGTTIVAALVDGDDLQVAHVGDSRVYVFSQGALKRITADHSYVGELVASGQITEEQARSHPFRNIVTRALGTKLDVKVDIGRHRAAPGDIFLLCSDGLTGMVRDDELAKIINRESDNLTTCVSHLIEAANKNGGDDNITAVLVRVV